MFSFFKKRKLEKRIEDLENVIKTLLKTEIDNKEYIKIISENQKVTNETLRFLLKEQSETNHEISKKNHEILEIKKEYTDIINSFIEINDRFINIYEALNKIETQNKKHPTSQLNANISNEFIKIKKQIKEHEEIAKLFNRFVTKYPRVRMEKALPDTLGKYGQKGWQQILEDFGNRCPLTNEERIQKEHFIAISIGHGGTYPGNIYPLGGSLNGSKNSTNPFLWIRGIKDQTIKENFEKLVQYLAKENQMSAEEFQEYVFWCYDNPRTVEEVERDGNVTSKELFYKNKNEYESKRTAN